MFNASKLINEVLGAAGGATGGTGSSSAMQKGKEYLSNNAGGLAGGAVAGGLAGYMMGSKKGRKMAKKTVQYGGLALVAGLAYKAYSDWQGNKNAAPQQGMDHGTGAGQMHGQVSGHAHNTQTPPPSQQYTAHQTPQQAAIVPPVPEDSAFAVEAETETANSFGAALVSAMIAAAKADGQIDSAEQDAIFGKIDELGLSNDEKAFLMDQLRRPLDIDSLVALAQNKEQAVELYEASLMAIEVDDPAEQGYLSMFSARLKLEPELVSHIHGSVAQAVHA
ncbi:tellurite resistance TerB family protein [Kiloniella sp. EL199]|uniref:tellurite resistance TerB family protein n=1 Tax=Kiloniella sp. EL199 TaxID=2107581 RepID=UPI000EA0205B|nr:tellurite resistance TerB family protein [Kiloniella sp. EL199]